MYSLSNGANISYFERSWKLFHTFETFVTAIPQKM